MDGTAPGGRICLKEERGLATLAVSNQKEGQTAYADETAGGSFEVGPPKQTAIRRSQTAYADEADGGRIGPGHPSRRAARKEPDCPR